MNKAHLALFIVIIALSIAVLAILTSKPPTEKPAVTPTPTPSLSSTPSNSATDTSQEQLSIINVQFVPQNVVIAYLVNSGDKDVTISQILIDGYAQASTPIYSTGSSNIQANTQATLTFNFNWQRGQSYEVRLVTANGKSITYSATVP